MDLNSDFSELFSTFNAVDARYLVVGGWAFTFHARPRYTKDLDLWVDATPDNGERVYRALAQFGAPLSGTSVDDFSQPGCFFIMGAAPTRIDILTVVDGLVFAEAWERRVPTYYGDVPICVLGRDDLIRNKRMVGRPQDVADVLELERVQRRTRPH